MEKICGNCKHFKRENEWSECLLIGYDLMDGMTDKTDRVTIDAGSEELGGADYANLCPKENFGCVLWEAKDCVTAWDESVESFKNDRIKLNQEIEEIIWFGKPEDSK